MGATDLSHFGGNDYLIVIHYYSKFIEMAKLSSTTSQQVVIHLKSILAHHGIPEVLRSDNGPQYSAYKFKSFANKYGFEHTTISPHYSQSNGEAERAVKI